MFHQLLVDQSIERGQPNRRRDRVGQEKVPAGRSISTRNPERRPTKFCTIQFCKIDWLSAGREGPFSRVEIIDEGGSVLASGERGETRPSSGHHREEIDAAKSLGQDCNKVDGRQCADGRSSVRRRRSVPRPAPFACASSLDP
jgi:hypothetical protein